MTTPRFTLNGRPVALADCDPTESLLRWLKRQRLHGTKEGCADGDCGACTVALVEADGEGRAHYRAVNSCLLPLGTLPGRELLTVEALADGERLHPVQQAMVEHAGSQCGYCTPGFVMSLFAGYYAGALDDRAIEGNLCRCTGYLPIRAAARALAEGPAADDGFALALTAPRPPLPAVAVGGFHNPTTLEEALALKARHPDAAWIAGATDLGVALSHGRAVAPILIALDRITALQTLSFDANEVRIGAGVTLDRLERELAGVLPALDAMLAGFAGTQIRNRATLGGNLGTASPIGDLLPVLLAHDAVLELASARGARTLPVAEFFLDYRKTALAADELVSAVRVPRRADWTCAAYKVAKRPTDDISIVAAAFAWQRDDAGGVRDVRLAYGGVAAIPQRALAVEAWLRGRALDAATVDEAGRRLAAAFEPLSDLRAAADYRRALCANLFARFVAEHAS